MKIALVDDDKRALDLLKEPISAQLGMAPNIDIYHSGKALLESWIAGKYDLVILDIYMLEQNGIGIAERIREANSGIILAML